MLKSGTPMTKIKPEKDEQPDAPAAAAENDVSSELGEPRWSVVSFESVAVHGLTYADAKTWLEKLQKQNVSGLCIITDEAAARMSKQ
jgi:hypothetical protein